LLAGENPPPGALSITTCPAADGAVKLDVLNGQGKVIRTYSSTDPVRNPDPATDPVAYNKICQQTPTAPDCNLPLYWPAPQQVLKTTAGMHRFSWDHALRSHRRRRRRWTRRRRRRRRGSASHLPGVNSPWVAPGTYTVRLTVNGKSMTQPITVKMDPRVKITPEVQQIFTLTTQMEDSARNAETAYKDARALRRRSRRVRNRPPTTRCSSNWRRWRRRTGGGRWWTRRGGRGGGGGGSIQHAGRGGARSQPEQPRGQMIAAVQPMQSAEMPPTAAQLAGLQSSSKPTYGAVMAKWAALRAKAGGQAAPAQAAGHGAAK
jgi:hypothetical protein